MRRRLTCHHEAAHSLVRWFFGYSTERAIVLTVEEVRARVPIIRLDDEPVFCEGLVEGYDIIGPPFGPVSVGGTRKEEDERNRIRSIARDIDLINCYAGFVAEAHYLHISTNVAMFNGGMPDIEHARMLADAWHLPSEEAKALHDASQRRAAALVRSPSGSAAIRAMADAIMDGGEIDGNEIAELCRPAYGGRQCEFGAWNRCWPPTLAQLRAGYIPEARPAAA